MDTGDIVLHRPTNERWVVAFVSQCGKHLTCLGWPEYRAEVADCELLETADDGQRQALLESMASLDDGRGIYARHRLRSA